MRSGMNFNQLTFLSTLLLSILGCCRGQCPVVPGYSQLSMLVNSGNLLNGDWRAVSDDDFEYIWNFCVPQTTVPNCGQTSGSAVCQSSIGHKNCGEAASVRVFPSPISNTVTFSYRDGTYSSNCGSARETNVTVVCNRDANSTYLYVKPTQLGSSGPSACQYQIVMLSPYACPSFPDQAPSNNQALGGSVTVDQSCCFYQNSSGHIVDFVFNNSCPPSPPHLTFHSSQRAANSSVCSVFQSAMVATPSWDTCCFYRSGEKIVTSCVSKQEQKGCPPPPEHFRFFSSQARSCLHC